MKEDIAENKITEQEVLNSLENAISSYKTNTFESITKKSMKNSGTVKRVSAKKATVKSQIKTPAKKLSVKPITISEEVEMVIKNKNKPVKPTKSRVTLKKNRLGKGVFKRNKNRIANFASLTGYYLNTYNRQLLTGALAIFLVSFVGYSTYIAYAFMSGNTGDVVTNVGKHIVLPTGETPKVYIIQSDKSEIFQNPLFAGIQVGDNVLTYTNAGKVIIYRSKEDKIVNVVNTN